MDLDPLDLDLPGRERDTPSSSNTDLPITTHENPRGNPCSSSHTPSTQHHHLSYAPSVHHNPHTSSSQFPESRDYPSQDDSHGHQRDTDLVVPTKRLFLEDVARDTISAINLGAVIVPDPQNANAMLKYSILSQTARMQADTVYFPPDAKVLCNWAKKEKSGVWKWPWVGQRGRGSGVVEVQQLAVVSISPMSTLDGARYLHSSLQSLPPSSSRKIGVHSFASATIPGGGFVDGAQSQEASIARSSNLYVSLTTTVANTFYALHAQGNNSGYYSHAMIYSPDVLVFRDDTGAWIPPYPIDVVTSPAVNAGQARKDRRRPKADVEALILAAMRERMGRVLALFENCGVKHLVLGSFGMGVLRNDVKALARVWAEFLVAPGARFGKAFESVVFTIPHEATRRRFESGFWGR